MKHLRHFCLFLSLVLFADKTFAADTRIKNLSNTTTTVEADDYFVVDGNTNGTRKLLGSNLYRYSNIIVSGETTVVANNTGNITIVAGTGITVTTDNTVKSITIAATNAGNVTAASTYGTDNVILRSDGTGRGSQGSGITIDDSNNLVTTGNVSGNNGNFTTGNYTTINATTLNVTTLNATNVIGTGNIILSPGGVTVTTAKVLTVTNSITLSGTDSTVFTFPTTTGNVVTHNSTTTLTNKQQLVSGGLGTDDTWEGLAVTGLNAGATIAQWEAVYLDGSSTWQLADANGSGTYPAVGLAVAAYSSTNPAVVVYSGTVRNDAWSWTPGGVIYLSATAGGLTQTAPATSGDKVQQVGRALTADIIIINVNSEYLTVQ